MTAWGDIDLAVRAMRAGAQSFVEKPWDNRKLVQILEREIAAGKGAREQSELHGREQRDALLIQRALMPASLPATRDSSWPVHGSPPARSAATATTCSPSVPMRSASRLPMSRARACRRRC